MVDYFKVLLNGADISELKNNRYLDFYGEFNHDTGEIQTKDKNNKPRTPNEKAYYKGLTFTIYESGKVFISGSLHKCWNDGKHNYNDFDLNGLLSVLLDLQTKFNIAPHQMILKCLELGVNITPPIATDEVLQYCFLHSTAAFKWCKVQNNGSYIQAEHSQYMIKIYNKAKQYRVLKYDVKGEVLRFEVKFMKMERLKRLGVSTVHDLLNYGLDKFVSVLVKEWEKVLFYDSTIISKSKSLLNYKNPIYWRELTKRRSAFNNNRLKLSELIKNHSENIPLQIANLIEEKGIILTKKGVHIDQDLPHDKITKGVHIDPLIIRSICASSISDKRTCLVTGLDISMQKGNSFLLSHTGLKYYLENEPKVFEKIRRKHLTRKWLYSDIATQIEKIAHHIRDCYRNNNRKYGGSEDQCSLF